MNENLNPLDLSAFEIEAIDLIFDQTPHESLGTWTLGHAITEIGASCDCNYTCTGSCMVPEL